MSATAEFRAKQRALFLQVSRESSRPTLKVRTVAELIDVYLRDHVDLYYRKGGRPTSVYHTARAALARIEAAAGDVAPKAITIRSLDQCRQMMLVEKLDRSTVNRYTTLIVQMFSWAATRELCDPNVPLRLKLLQPIQRGRMGVEPDRPPVKPVPTPVLKALFRGLLREARKPMTNAADRSIAAKMLLTMLAVQLRTGMRPGELVQLRWSAIDTSGGQIWVYRPPEHKTSHHGLDRTIFIGPKAAKLLQAWSHPADGDLIFNAPRRDSYHRKLARWLKRLKLPKVHPHQLRHNFATRVERRADEKAAQRLLGHTRLKTTRVYVDPDTTRAAELIQRIG